MSTPNTTSRRGFLSPSLQARLSGYFGIRTRFQGAAWFFLKDIWARLRRGELRVLFRNSDIREQAFAEFYTAARHNFIAFESTTAVASLVPAAHGTVLDLGPGAGTQLDRFDAARVDHIFGVEPNTAFAPAFNDRLRETALGQDGKYTLVPCGIEDGETLAQHGVVESSIDCVVCMQVLCSVVHPDEQARHLYRLLKPGGELLFWEHCRNTDVVTRAVQWLWGLVWPSVFGGCRLDRVTKEAFLDAGVWQTVEVETSMEPHDLMPRVWGRLVKPETT